MMGALLGRIAFAFAFVLSFATAQLARLVPLVRVVLVFPVLVVIELIKLVASLVLRLVVLALFVLGAFWLTMTLRPMADSFVQSLPWVQWFPDIAAHSEIGPASNSDANPTETPQPGSTQ